jgi:hypothetical protein
MAKAAGMGLTPGEDCYNEADDATHLRKRLWSLLFSPPKESVFHWAAEEARRVTGGDCSTVAHRVESCGAMLKAVSKQVQESHIKEVRAELCQVCNSGEHPDHLYCRQCGVPKGGRVTSGQTVEAGVDLGRDEYTNLRRCSLEGCLNFGYYDPLTDKRERCCGRSHERVLTEWEGRPEGVERTDHLKCLLVTCERDKCYPHAFCGKRHATRYTAQLAANLDQAPGGLKGGPFLWPDVHTGMPSPPASPPHGESDGMAESPITLVVHGPAGCYA